MTVKGFLGLSDIVCAKAYALLNAGDPQVNLMLGCNLAPQHVMKPSSHLLAPPACPLSSGLLWHPRTARRAAQRRSSSIIPAQASSTQQQPWKTKTPARYFS